MSRHGTASSALLVPITYVLLWNQMIQDTLDLIYINNLNIALYIVCTCQVLWNFFLLLIINLDGRKCIWKTLAAARHINPSSVKNKSCHNTPFGAERASQPTSFLTEYGLDLKNAYGALQLSFHGTQTSVAKRVISKDNFRPECFQNIIYKGLKIKLSSCHNGQKCYKRY